MAQVSERAPQQERQSLRVRLIPFIESYGIVLVIVLAIAVLAILEPNVFLTWRNFSNIGRQIAVLALLALGQYVVILTAGIDLSVGSVMALSMVTLAVASEAGWPWYLVLLVGPLVGMGIGLLNGAGLTLLNLPHPFIVTLGMLNIARGLTNLVSGGVPISGLPEPVRYLGAAEFTIASIGGRDYEVPVSLVVVLVFYLGFWLFLAHTRLGRHIFAVGGNVQAARVSGINVNRLLVIVYTLSGMMAGFAGLLMAGRTNSGFPNAGLGAELDAIAAVIIGGASFFGGRGTALGVFAGVLIMGLLKNGLNLMNVSVFWQQLLIGIVIIVAVYIDVLRRRVGSRQ